MCYFLKRHLLSKDCEKEDNDGRFPQSDFKAQNHGARSIFANMHKLDYKDFQHWADKQVYLNLGNFLLGVAALGLDAIAMEGFDLKALDEEFSLREKGFTTNEAYENIEKLVSAGFDWDAIIMTGVAGMGNGKNHRC